MGATGFIVAMPRDVARLMANPEFVAAMNDDTRVEVTPEEFPELHMSTDDIERWGAERKAASTTKRP